MFMNIICECLLMLSCIFLLFDIDEGIKYMILKVVWEIRWDSLLIVVSNVREKYFLVRVFILLFREFK